MRWSIGPTEQEYQRDENIQAHTVGTSEYTFYTVDQWPVQDVLLIAGGVPVSLTSTRTQPEGYQGKSKAEQSRETGKGHGGGRGAVPPSNIYIEDS